MSDAYENVVGGKLKLKGKALDVKAGGVAKKKKKRNRDHDDAAAAAAASASEGREVVATVEGGGEGGGEEEEEGGGRAATAGRWDSNLTPAERRYVEQRARIESQRLAKTSDKSHRDRIEDFNHYLANMSEHYDIPKVGPG